MQSQTYPSMKHNLMLSASSLSSYLHKSISFYFFPFCWEQQAGDKQKEQSRCTAMYNIYLGIHLLLSSKATGPLSWQRPQTGQQKQSEGWHRWGREAAVGMEVGCQPGQTLFSRYLLHFLLKTRTGRGERRQRQFTETPETSVCPLLVWTRQLRLSF